MRTSPIAIPRASLDQNRTADVVLTREEIRVLHEKVPPLVPSDEAAAMVEKERCTAIA